MDEKNSKRINPVCIASSVTLLVVVLLNFVSLFFLPTTITTVLSDRRLSTLVFVIIGCVMVGLAGVMAVFSPRQKAWLAAEIVLALVDTVLVAYNFTLLG